MIDNALLKRLLIVAAALSVLSAAATAAFGLPLAFAGGIALGYVLGAAPVASWAWVGPRLLAGGKGRGLAVALLAVKMAFYAGALYLGVYQKRVDPVGLLVGMVGVGVVLILGILLHQAPAPAKEAA